MARLRTYNKRAYKYYGWNSSKREIERDRQFLLSKHKSVLVLKARRKGGGWELWVLVR